MANPVLSPEAIWDQARMRRAEAVKSGRMARYGRNLDYYFGNQSPRTGGPAPLIPMNSIGMAMLREVGSAMNIPRTVTSNKIAPLVDDRQAFLGRLPSSRVDVPDYSPAGIAKAEKQDKFLQSTYELCQMELQQAQAGFYLSSVNDAVYLLEIDWKSDRRVVMSSMDPQFCFPTWWRGHRKFEVYDMIVAYYEDVDVLARDFDYYPESDDEDYHLLVTYISPYQRTQVVGKDLVVVSHVEWDLKFCPAVWMQSKITQEGAYGYADIGQVLELQDIYNFGLNVTVDGLVRFVYPMVGIRNPIENPDGGVLPVGPDAYIALGDNGGIQVAQMGGDVGVLSNFQNSISQDITQGVGSSLVRQQGMPDRSNISGHAIRAAQGPEATRIDLIQVVLGAAFVRLNAYAMQMQERAPMVGKHEFEINGRLRGKTFVDKFMAERDVDGWYRNSATWDSMMGMSKAQRMQVAGQAKTLHLVPERTLLDWMQVDDPEAARQEIDRDIIHEAEVQARAQIAAQKVLAESAGGNPGAQTAQGQAEQGQGPGGAPPSSNGGSSPAQPSSPRVVRPSYMQPGQAPQAAPQMPPGVNPTGVTLKQVSSALQDVQGLKGQVFAVGDLAESGMSVSPRILISDYRDHGKVVTALRPIAANVKVEFKKESDMPEVKEKVA